MGRLRAPWEIPDLVTHRWEQWDSPHAVPFPPNYQAWLAEAAVALAGSVGASSSLLFWTDGQGGLKARAQPSWHIRDETARAGSDLCTPWALHSREERAKHEFQAGSLLSLSWHAPWARPVLVSGIGSEVLHTQVASWEKLLDIIVQREKEILGTLTGPPCVCVRWKQGHFCKPSSLRHCSGRVGKLFSLFLRDSFGPVSRCRQRHPVSHRASLSYSGNVLCIKTTRPLPPHTSAAVTWQDEHQTHDVLVLLVPSALAVLTNPVLGRWYPHAWRCHVRDPSWLATKWAPLATTEDLCSTPPSHPEQQFPACGTSEDRLLLFHCFQLLCLVERPTALPSLQAGATLVRPP